jgi:hypothetical protein
VYHLLAPHLLAPHLLAPHLIGSLEAPGINSRSCCHAGPKQHSCAAQQCTLRPVTIGSLCQGATILPDCASNYCQEH